MEVVLSAAAITGPVASVAQEVPTFHRLLSRSPGQWFGTAMAGLFILLILNVLGVVVPILLIGAGRWGLLALIECIALVAVSVIFFRHTVQSSSKHYAEEAFFRDYAGTRGLEQIPPLTFAAQHAQAKVPFKADRVLAGPVPGLPQAAVAIKGAGRKRGDVIAVVAGPSGPFAQEPLETTGPGLTAEQLEAATDRLAAQLR
jgi:hypothetical protein